MDALEVRGHLLTRPACYATLHIAIPGIALLHFIQSTTLHAAPLAHLGGS